MGKGGIARAQAVGDEGFGEKIGEASGLPGQCCHGGRAGGICGGTPSGSGIRCTGGAARAIGADGAAGPIRWPVGVTARPAVCVGAAARGAGLRRAAGLIGAVVLQRVSLDRVRVVLDTVVRRFLTLNGRV